MTTDRKRPQLLDVQGEPCVNAAGHLRADLVAFQRHVDAVMAAEAVKASPRSLTELLWDIAGAKVDALIGHACSGPGTRGTIPHQRIFDVAFKAAREWKATES